MGQSLRATSAEQNLKRNRGRTRMRNAKEQTQNQAEQVQKQFKDYWAAEHKQRTTFRMNCSVIRVWYEQISLLLSSRSGVRKDL